MNIFARLRLILLAVALGLLVITVITALWINREFKRPRPHQAAGRTITIEPRASTTAIIAQLHREGILADEFPARLYMRFFTGSNTVKAGDYEFRSPISTRDAMGKLLRGEIATRQFTIPEGYNRFDIATVLAGLPGLKQAPPARPDDLMGLLANVSLIADLDPQATTLEGYLFPDTYEYSATVTREQLIEGMVRRFRRVFTSDKQRQAAERGMSIRQIVTLASLIEEEAKVDNERELISSVFHRRLALGVPLACDPTVIYAALLEGRYRGKIYQSDLDRDSPYNTYRRAGLPPGPIASPGKRSLDAALNPANTDYLYFVVDASRTDGAHTFSASSAAHVRAVEALRHWERDTGNR